MGKYDEDRIRYVKKCIKTYAIRKLNFLRKDRDAAGMTGRAPIKNMGIIVAVGGGFDEPQEDYALILHTIRLSGKTNPNFLLVPTSQFDTAPPIKS